MIGAGMDPKLDTQKRVVTSAIPNMSVAEVRRGLDFVRTQWKEQQQRHKPFHINQKLFNDMTLQDFCFKFTLGHHYKRHAKSKRGSERKEDQRGDDAQRCQKKPRVE